MTTESSLPKMKLTPHVVREQMRIHRSNWTGWAAVCGLCFGIVSPVIGSILTVAAWFTGPAWHGFHFQRAGTVLFVLTIPLLAFGAHCLDLSDRKNAAARRLRANKFG